MLRMRVGRSVGLVVTALLLAACSDSMVAPSTEMSAGSALFARKPSSSPGNPGDNNSCDNNNSGNKTRKSPNDKNQCSDFLVSFTLVFDKSDIALGSATYNPCPQSPFPFSGYNGETIGIAEPFCIGNGYNLILEGVPPTYTVTPTPDGSCSYQGGDEWYCDVISLNTVITIAASN